MAFPVLNQSPPQQLPTPAVQTDELGREVHTMQAKPSIAVSGPDVVSQLWKQDQINKDVWVKLYTAIVGEMLRAPGEAINFGACAEYADHAYLQFHLKSNPPRGR